MSKHSIGKTIASSRKAKGWTQVELAEKLNVSDKAISKWESEAGFPEISQLPAMAELFGVSIDYLMTGKLPEKEIITMSKAELCAKNDDIALLQTLNYSHKDESGHDLIYYVVKYESLKVFTSLIDSENSSVNVGIKLKAFGVENAIKLSLLSNRLDIIPKIPIFNFSIKSLKSLASVNEENWIKQNQLFNACILSDSIFETIVCDERISKQTFNHIIAPYENRFDIWYFGFPYLIHQSYLHNKVDIFNQLIEISTKNNDYGLSQTESSPTQKFYTLNIANGQYQFFGLVRILEDTIKLALSRGDFNNTIIMNNINKKLLAKKSSWLRCYVASDDEIRLAKLKRDNSLSKTDLQIQAAIHNDILNIAELKEIKNFKAIKNALSIYPIHIFELLQKWYHKKQWRELFIFAVEDDNRCLADSIIAQSTEEVERHIIEYWNLQNAYSKANKNNINNGELYISQDEIKYRQSARNQKTLKEIADYLQLVRQRIINELSLHFDKERIIGELTEDYFNIELKKSNFDTVVIKLCVRFEAVLKCDFGYVGSFIDMIDKYCSEKLTWTEDDGWGYDITRSDDETISLLHKLRKVRNSIVHAEKTNARLTSEELQKCIDYICKL